MKIQLSDKYEYEFNFINIYYPVYFIKRILATLCGGLQIDGFCMEGYDHLKPEMRLTIIYGVYIKFVIAQDVIKTNMDSIVDKYMF